MDGYMKPILVATIAFGSMMASATAQTAQPYAGMQMRPIKALSDQQIADLKAGRGMGLALAAELNGYPGPRHLLELADQLGLSPNQRAKVMELFDAMEAETIPIGERFIAQESALDRLFSDHTITPQSLEAATAGIGETQAKLRNAHLKYHLSTVAILQPQQLHRYAELRGYEGDGQEGEHMTHHPN
jgi:Spy/CpxP family protein refolding chaperone